MYADLGQVDDAGMWLGAVAHDALGRGCQIDGKAQTLVDDGHTIDQRCLSVARGEFGV